MNNIVRQLNEQAEIETGIYCQGIQRLQPIILLTTKVTMSSVLPNDSSDLQKSYLRQAKQLYDSAIITYTKLTGIATQNNMVAYH